jgi:glycosyltransferase involved in cell wall biosynthesis
MLEKKIKILYLITSTSVGGAEIILKHLVNFLDKEKFAPLVVSVVPIGEIGKEIIAGGFTVKSLVMKNKLDFLVFWRFLQMIKKERPDIIHAHMFHAIILARLAKLFFKKIKVISTIHSENIGGWWREKILGATDFLSDYSTAVSGGVTALMIKKGVAPADKIMTIYNGIDLASVIRVDSNFDLRKKFNLANDVKIILNVGRLSPVKGLDVLLAAVKKLNQTGVKLALVLAGDGPERKNLEELAAALKISQKVFFVGWQKNVSNYLAAADLFVLPSRREAFGIVILEAQAVGVPVVATALSGPREIIKDGETGFLVAKADAAELAEKIKYAVSLSEPDRKKIIASAQQMVREKFSAETMSRNYENLYLKTIKN